MKSLGAASVGRLAKPVFLLLATMCTYFGWKIALGQWEASEWTVPEFDGCHSSIRGTQFKPRVKATAPLMESQVRVLAIDDVSRSWLRYYPSILVPVDDVRDADIVLHETVGDRNHDFVRKLVSSSRCSGKLIVIAVSGDNPPLEAIEGQEHVLLLAPRTPEHKGVPLTNQVVIPTISSTMYDHAPPPLGSPRNILMYFRGTLWPGLRSEMNAALQGRDGVVIEGVTGYWDTRGSFDSGLSESEWLREQSLGYFHRMDTSLFALAPRGKGSSSMRVWEALLSGAVPVLIDDSTRIVLGQYDLHSFSLHFDTSKTSWTDIYASVRSVSRNATLLSTLQRNGRLFCDSVLRRDFLTGGRKDPLEISDVLHGFTGEVLAVLLQRYLTGTTRSPNNYVTDFDAFRHPPIDTKWDIAASGGSLEHLGALTAVAKRNSTKSVLWVGAGCGMTRTISSLVRGSPKPMVYALEHSEARFGDIARIFRGQDNVLPVLTASWEDHWLEQREEREYLATRPWISRDGISVARARWGRSFDVVVLALPQLTPVGVSRVLEQVSSSSVVAVVSTGRCGSERAAQILSTSPDYRKIAESSEVSVFEWMRAE